MERFFKYHSLKDVFDQDTFLETMVVVDDWQNHFFVHPGSGAEWTVIQGMLHSMQ